MSAKAFWTAIALLVGGVLLLPALLVGMLAVVNGLIAGNGQLALTGAGFAGGAVVLAGLLWWVVRRRRPSGEAPGAD